MSSKMDRLRNALHQPRGLSDEQLLQAQAVAQSIPNPLRREEPKQESLTLAPSTFTRESRITQVAIETGNKTPYFARVSYELIDPNPYNARVTYKPQRIHKMASEIKADGQMVPGLATIRNGRFILAAGHYRWKGIGQAHIGYMDLMIYEGITDRELYKLSYKENAERSDQTVIDNALAWRKLLDDGIYDGESALAEETGISLSNVNKILSVLKLPKNTLEYIEEQEDFKFALSSLYELQLFSAVAGEEETLEMVKKIVQEDLTRDQIKNARVLLEDPKPPRKTKEISRQHKILGNDKQSVIGSIKDFDSGKIVLDVHIEDDDARRKVLDTLKGLFGID